MADVIELQREIVYPCAECKGQLWYIIVDKPDVTTILGFECTCGNTIPAKISIK